MELASSMRAPTRRRVHEQVDSYMAPRAVSKIGSQAFHLHMQDK